MRMKSPRTHLTLMMVGMGLLYMGKVLVRINAASSPSAFGLEVMTLLMANPDIRFEIVRRGEIVEVRELERSDG